MVGRLASEVKLLIRGYLAHLLRWLQDESAQQLGQERCWDTSGWTIHIHPAASKGVVGVPQQGSATDGSVGVDCAVFSMAFASCIMRDMDGFPGIEQRNMPKLRRQLALAISTSVEVGPWAFALE